MKKKAIIFCMFLTFILNAQHRKDISIQILNAKIFENKNVDIVIKNNSKVNYYILIDTLFLSDAKYDNDYFLNPYFVLSDANKNEVLKITDIIENSQNKDIQYFNKNKISLILLEIKSKENLHFKIPFKVKRIVEGNLSTHFFISRKEKYFGEVKYKLTEQFANMKYIKNRIDSLKNKKFDIYIGTIISNKVPIILDK